MDSKVTEYVELFEATKMQVGNEEIALALVEQIGKDRRVEAMTSRTGFGQQSSGDMPATEKQLSFMRRLGVEITPGMTKREASELIDSARSQAVTA
jgi:hypothetical protein